MALRSSMGSYTAKHSTIDTKPLIAQISKIHSTGALNRARHPPTKYESELHHFSTKNQVSLDLTIAEIDIKDLNEEKRLVQIKA